MQPNPQKYGIGDNSYQAAGQLEGITALVESFYEAMDVLPNAEHIRQMHAPDLTDAKLRFSYFLSGWLGGPRLHKEHFGGVHVPRFHQQFPIGDAERDAWLECMKAAIEQQPFEASFKAYLFEQLKVPANAVVRMNNVAD
jgi:hemoglobin